MPILRAILVSIFCAAALSPAGAEEHTYSHSGIAKDAERYEAYIKSHWQPGRSPPAALRTTAERQLAQDPRASSRLYASAVVAEDKNPENWLGLARALLAIEPDPNNGGERYDLPVNASGAAYRAYRLAQDPKQQAASLFVLSQAMQRRSYWRPAIDALKTSLGLVEDAVVRAAYEDLRAEHGFRMIDYATESDVADPRICVQFSETLSRSIADFSKYVAVDGKDPQALVAEQQRLCLGGVEHGHRYEVHLRAGLPSDVGEVLAKPVNLAIYVPDRKPFVAFTGKAYVLPARGQQGIPVVSVNTEKVAIEVYRVGDRNLASQIENGSLERQLSGYELSQLQNETGAKVYQGEMDVTSELNEEVTTAFPVNEAIGPIEPGAYAMVARPAGEIGDDWSARSTQWFIVSDLGLTAFSGDDGVHVFVRSLAGTEPIAEADVRLIARNNEVLAKRPTDGNGYVHFDGRMTKGEGGLQPAILVAENKGGEYAFLNLRTNAFDLSDRGVKGRTAPGPIDAYLYAERGVYRPGEEVDLTALVRDGTGTAESLPVTLIVSRPDGVEHARYALKDQGLGGRTQTLALSDGAMTGTWRARIHIDPKDDAITQVTFLVEDFVPERIDMTLKAAEGALAPDKDQTVSVTGRYLYGPPAADLGLEGDIIVRPAKSGLKNYPGYQFGLADEDITRVRESIEELAKTGADGTADMRVALPQVQRTAKPLEADILLRLREPGGRTIERSVTVPVDLGEPRIGVKPRFDASSVGEGETATFDVVLLDAVGTPASTQGLHWELFRLETSWQWYNSGGQWLYEPQTITRKAGSGVLSDEIAGAPSISTKVAYGRYRLEVTSTDPKGPATSVPFTAGWYTGGDAADSPELLDVALDKASYSTGDTAKVRIASKHAGKALVAVLGGTLHLMREIDIGKGGGDVDVVVGDDWGPGAYATVLFYRPMDETAKRMPSRSVGIKWIGIDQSPRTLKVALAGETKIESASALEVPVTISGLAGGEEAYVTVAAVDVGILNLTQYQAPVPETHFYAQRQLGMEIRDVYGRLIDGMRAERGRLRSGGDGMDGMQVTGSPPVEATVAFFSGIVPVDAEGRANVSFDMPDFNGTVRLMAVAWSKDKLGSASRDVVVRDAIALTVSGPRFLTLGDRARLDVGVHNVDGANGAYEINVGLIDDPGAVAAGTSQDGIARDLALQAGERKSEQFDIIPEDVGRSTYSVRVTGPGGIDVSRQLTFDVKPPSGDIKRTTVSSIAGNGGSLTLSRDLVRGMLSSRTRVNVSVGPRAKFDVPGLLTTLDRYPYGCAEQTVSKALPLLYANAVAAELGLGSDADLKGRVQGAIDRVFEMQDTSGAFGAWGPGSADLWLTSYVMDFLTRAREQGFAVKDVGYKLALDRLRNFVVNAQDFQKGGEDRAYALYVLARNSRAPIGELRYYADARLDRFATPLSRAHLGAALAMMGDIERAEAAFQSAIDDFEIESTAVARRDYGSGLRDGAALVTLASETGAARSSAPSLIDVLATAYVARDHTSTQEQAWMLLAANALGEQIKKTSLSIDGAPIVGSLLRSIMASDLERDIVITNNGDDRVDAVISVTGSSLEPEPEAARGFKVARAYYTLSGEAVDLASASGGESTIRQNDRFVAVVRVDSDEAAGRVLLVDRLPAGFEIENPRLVESGDIATLSWLKSSHKPTHTEFRDDRFVASFDFSARVQSDTHGAESDGAAGPETNEAASSAATVAYIVRAVTPGTFLHPAATVEDMYRPERYARTSAGKLVVAQD